ncbi:MAG: hypothetical protein R3E08_12335 [Thiotrichaceae bacterium]
MMNSLQQQINQEINDLPLMSQKEILDFVLFVKNRINTESNSEYLANNPTIKQAIIDGLNTPLSDCSDKLDW